ncbi:Serine/threonine protein kinase [Nonomuraea solani]|uniref:non-specific serine/threonine protein kinase n=1 Tax=Nonomuraea solani TaxID=1144553 RepID=A0A1H5SXC6_9ACTN|nr:PASTA domain-containing protein [Nonomuraea solani]SEF54588.1 Serine/threonine protein kinase [Nonomuraea solani]
MPTAQPLRTGDPQRLGEYALSGRLGEGGQGAVFLGSRGGETYAVKLLHGPVGDERAAFLREVELAKHVARFCTAQVIDAGFDEGRPYIVSEYVDGPSLQREVALTGPRRGGALERLAVSTATALAAIHRAGIVHRDFKPQNVLLGSDGPRVIDFGLARALDAAATVSGRGVGTPAYMAPEQITAAAVTGAADVFSWGATMCFAANASAPFGQDSVAPVLHRILTAPPELGRLDGRLRTLVEACLDKDARNRPSSRELLFELLGESSQDVPAEVLRSPPPHILRDTPILVPEQRAPAGDSGATPLAEPEATGAPGGYVMPDVPRPRRGWPRAALAVCVALLVTAAVLLTMIVPSLNKSDAVPGPQAAGPSNPPPTEPAPTVAKSAPAKTRSAGPRESAVDPPVARPPTVTVPLLTGLTRGAATRAIQDAGLVLGSVTPIDSGRKIGQVLASQPASGTFVNQGAKVSLQVSAGLAVPAVTGMRRKAAESALTGTGLTVGAITTTCSQSPDGRVLSTRPKAGRRVPGGTPVALTVARKGATVPSVVGQAREDARGALIAAGLTVQTKDQVVEDESRVGTVLAQSVPPGVCGAPGASIVITIGMAAPPSPDPGEPTETPTGPIPGD